MSKIVLARIDDRLIHGQVMTAWLQYTDGNHIVIVDDGTAKDSFLQTVMKMSVPQGVKLDIFTEADGAKFLQEDHGQDNIIILAKTPEVYLNLIEAGVQLDEVIVGGMGANGQRKKFYKNISASPSERGTFQKIIDHGTTMKVRIVPSDNATDVEGLLK